METLLPAPVYNDSKIVTCMRGIYTINNSTIKSSMNTIRTPTRTICQFFMA